MKKIIIAALILFSIGAKCQENDLARVKKVNGVEVYVMNEPLRDYDVLVDVGTGLKAESLITGGLINKSIAGRIEQFINRVKKDNANIDAVVYSSGKRIVGVKFKTEATLENKGIARALKIKGIPTFVMCEPLKAYTTLKSKGGGIKWKSAFSGGLINNSIEEDVTIIVNKLEDVKNVQGFLFDGSKEGEAIGFKS